MVNFDNRRAVVHFSAPGQRQDQSTCDLVDIAFVAKVVGAVEQTVDWWNSRGLPILSTWKRAENLVWLQIAEQVLRFSLAEVIKTATNAKTIA